MEDLTQVNLLALFVNNIGGIAGAGILYFVLMTRFFRSRSVITHALASVLPVSVGFGFVLLVFNGVSGPAVVRNTFDIPLLFVVVISAAGMFCALSMGTHMLKPRNETSEAAA